MRAMRRHLRMGVATWLVGHVLAFSALLPRDCCAAHSHGPDTAAEAPDAVDHSAHGMAPTGHEHHAMAQTETAPSDAEPGGAYCPMRGADGAPCPMHGGAAPSAAACQMTGVCNQPAAALAAVLMQGAMPPPPFALLPRGAESLEFLVASEQPLTLAVPPDSPPPRL